MSLPEWTEAPLAQHHDRKAFDCGEAALNEYLARYARQNHESGGAKTFIAGLVDEPSRILGYYTLAPASLAYARAPSIVTRGLGRYEVPVFRLGRLAVDRSVQGQRLGGPLLLAAGTRCLAVAELVGGVALLIDAKSERAAAWYRGYGAVALEDRTDVPHPAAGHDRRGHERVRPEVRIPRRSVALRAPAGTSDFGNHPLEVGLERHGARLARMDPAHAGAVQGASSR